jgi:hypothetical protein
MLNIGVGTRKDLTFVTVVLPAHPERRRTVGAEHLEDLSVSANVPE